MLAERAFAVADMRGQTVCGVPADEAAIITMQLEGGKWLAWKPTARDLNHFDSEEGSIGGWVAEYACDVEIDYGQFPGHDVRQARFHRLGRDLVKPATTDGADVVAEEFDVRKMIVGEAAATAHSVNPADICDVKSPGNGTECWMEIANIPGCYVWNPHLNTRESVTWSGGCSDGLAEGKGTLTWSWWMDRRTASPLNIQHIGEGQIMNGKQEGHWVIQHKGFDEGAVSEGEMVDGRRHGHWLMRYRSGETRSWQY